MTAAQLIKAFAAVWRKNTVLQAYPIRSTRIPASSVGAEDSVFPYAHIFVDKTGSRFHSGPSKTGKYRVDITVYCGENLGVANTISDQVATLIDMDVGLPIDDESLAVLSVVPQDKNPEMDEVDYYGSDCQTIFQRWEVTVLETMNAPAFTNLGV